jgi:hypothetical protein
MLRRSKLSARLPARQAVAHRVADNRPMPDIGLPSSACVPSFAGTRASTMVDHMPRRRR